MSSEDRGEEYDSREVGVLLVALSGMGVGALLAAHGEAASAAIPALSSDMGMRLFGIVVIVTSGTTILLLRELLRERYNFQYRSEAP